MLDERFACEAQVVLQGTTAGGHLGHACAVADWNDDGYDDLATVGIHKGPLGLVDVIVWVYLGSGAGLGTISTLEIHDVPMALGVGPSIAFVRDLNGGGRPELVVGASGALTPSGLTNAGRVAIFFGESVLLQQGSQQFVTFSQADVVYVGAGADELLGASVSSAGDVDGDGVADLVFGAPGPLDHDAGKTGKAYILFGPTVLAHAQTMGGGSGSAWSIQASADVVLNGPFADSRYGAAVRGVGDVDGDGLDDVAVGAPDMMFEGAFMYDYDAPGTAWLYRHTAFDPLDPHDPGLELPSAVGSHYPAGVYTTYGFGFTLAGGVDVNFDGRPDVLVGAPLFEDAMRSIVGAVFAFSVSAAGEVTASYDFLDPNSPTSAVRQPITYEISPAPTPGGPLDNLDALAWFGYSLDGVGEYSEDDFEDWAVGAPLRSNSADQVCALQGGRQTGRAFIIRGGRWDEPFPPEPIARYKGESQADGAGRTGTGVSVGAGDFDGNGSIDLFVGGSRYTASDGMGGFIDEVGRGYEFRNVQ